MALGRRIACCLGLVAATVLLLGCGSSDSTSANIDPDIAGDFTDKLAVISGYADEGDCPHASQALETLKTAVDNESGQTGEQFTADLQELLDRLGKQIDDQCEETVDTTSSSTTDETTETQPILTDTTSTETSTTTKPTTTSTSTSTSSTTSTPPPPQGNGPPVNPPGGGTPGGGINPSGKRHSPGPAIKKPKHDKGQKQVGMGPKHGNEKEHGR